MLQDEWETRRAVQGPFRLSPGPVQPFQFRPSLASVRGCPGHSRPWGSLTSPQTLMLTSKTHQVPIH